MASSSAQEQAEAAPPVDVPLPKDMHRQWDKFMQATKATQVRSRSQGLRVLMRCITAVRGTTYPAWPQPAARTADPLGQEKGAQEVKTCMPAGN